MVERHLPLTTGETATELPGLEVSRPARELSFEADFLVPAMQATFTGLVSGSAVGFIGARLTGAPLGDAWATSVVTCIALAWFWRLAVVTGTLYNVERIAGLDINRDGVTGKPNGHIVALNPYQGQRAQQRDNREGVESVFGWFAQGCALDTSMATWEPQIGRDQYQEWRDLLINSGYARWKGRSPTAGWELTAEPSEIVAALHGGD